MNEVTISKQKTLDKVKQSLHERLETGKAPFHVADQELAKAAIDRLRSLDGEHWGTVWAEAGERLAFAARHCVAKGDYVGARDAFLKAYGLYHVGRYPIPNHPRKEECYVRSRENFMRAGAYFDPPVEVVSLPFSGQPGEGDRVIVYVRRKPGLRKQPVIIRCAGIDTWKEERHDLNETFVNSGFACVTVDMPGTGESPVVGSIDAERQFLPIFEWIKLQDDLDDKKIVLIGMSYGGYWATKVAHRYPEHLAAAVSWGGAVHHNFQREWVLKSQFANSYLMDLPAARARCVGVATYEEYADRVATFSLLDQGLLDNPHPPILLVNGRDDRQIPIEDIYILLQHGGPKTVRLFPGGHMGYTPQTLPTVMSWIRDTLKGLG